MLDCQINLVLLHYDKGRNHNIVAGPSEGLQQAGNCSYRAGKRAVGQGCRTYRHHQSPAGGERRKGEDSQEGQQYHQGHGEAPLKGKRATGGEAAAYR